MKNIEVWYIQCMYTYESQWSELGKNVSDVGQKHVELWEVVVAEKCGVT